MPESAARPSASTASDAGSIAWATSVPGSVENAADGLGLDEADDVARAVRATHRDDEPGPVEAEGVEVAPAEGRAEHPVEPHRAGLRIEMRHAHVAVRRGGGRLAPERDEQEVRACRGTWSPPTRRLSRTAGPANPVVRSTRARVACAHEVHSSGQAMTAAPLPRPRPRGSLAARRPCRRPRRGRWCRGPSGLAAPGRLGWSR